MDDTATKEQQEAQRAIGEAYRQGYLRALKHLDDIARNSVKSEEDARFLVIAGELVESRMEAMGL